MRYILIAFFFSSASLLASNLETCYHLNKELSYIMSLVDDGYKYKSDTIVEWIGSGKSDLVIGNNVKIRNNKVTPRDEAKPSSFVRSMSDREGENYTFIAMNLSADGKSTIQFKVDAAPPACQITKCEIMIKRNFSFGYGGVLTDPCSFLREKGLFLLDKNQ